MYKARVLGSAGKGKPQSGVSRRAQRHREAVASYRSLSSSDDSSLGASAYGNYLGEARQQLLFKSPEPQGAAAATGPEPTPVVEPDVRIEQGKRIPAAFKKYMAGLAVKLNPETQRWEHDEEAYLQLVEAIIRWYLHHGGVLAGEDELDTKAIHYDSYIETLNATSKQIADNRRAAAAHGGSNEEDAIPLWDSADVRRKLSQSRRRLDSDHHMKDRRHKAGQKQRPKKHETVDMGGCFCGAGKARHGQ
jgi:hypothetical protein